jgi:hypothetical protein
MLPFQDCNGLAKLLSVARAYDARWDDLAILLSPAIIYSLLEGCDISL